MPDWITLTPSLFYEVLNGTQQETVNVRPHQGTPLDPLHIALADATSQIRASIRSNGLNRLSADSSQIPPELRQHGTALALQKLQQIWPLLRLTKEQEGLLDIAAPTLKSVSEGTLPITLPSNPEPQETVRRSSGVQVTSSRKNGLRRRDLRGL